MQKYSSVAVGLAVVGAAGLLAGSGLAWHYRERALSAEAERAAAAAAHALCAKPAAARPEVVAAPVPAPAAAGASKDLLADRDTRIAELESLLNERDAQLRDLESAVAARMAETPGGTNEVRRDRGRGRTDPARVLDPQQMAEMAQRRDEFRQQITDAYTEKMEKLKSRDTSAMSEEDRNAYSLMIQLLDDTWRVGEQLRNPDLPREDRGALFEKLRTNMSDLRPMLEAERTREFARIGTSLGYNADQAAAFAAQLNDVIDTTSMRSVFESGMRGAFGGFGGFGGRGRGGSGRDGGGAAGAGGGMAPP